MNDDLEALDRARARWPNATPDWDEIKAGVMMGSFCVFPFSDGQVLMVLEPTKHDLHVVFAANTGPAGLAMAHLDDLRWMAWRSIGDRGRVTCHPTSESRRRLYKRHGFEGERGMMSIPARPRSMPDTIRHAES